MWSSNALCCPSQSFPENHQLLTVPTFCQRSKIIVSFWETPFLDARSNVSLDNHQPLTDTKNRKDAKEESAWPKSLKAVAYFLLENHK